MDVIALQPFSFERTGIVEDWEIVRIGEISLGLGGTSPRARANQDVPYFYRIAESYGALPPYPISRDRQNTYFMSVILYQSYGTYPQVYLACIWAENNSHTPFSLSRIFPTIQ